MVHDALDSAYATLGLTRTASAVAVKRQYRALVRKWHPDKFGNDPQGMADATLMLKAVNHAYRTILEHRAPGAFTAVVEPPSAGAHQPGEFGRRLTQQERDEIIDAIRQSETLLLFDDDVAGWRSRAVSLTIAVSYAVATWKSGEAVRMLAFSVFPLLCIWFPDTLGEMMVGRVTKSSPPIFVWFFGWVVLFTPLLAFGIIWLGSRS